MSAFGLEDHYYRPGPLDSYLDQRAVTIQANEDGLLGLFWLSPGVRSGGIEIEAAFNDERCTGFVGRDDRPIWLAPFTGDIALIIDKADDSFCTPTERAGLARRIVALLGLSHFQPTVEILAMVTKATIGELIYSRPGDQAEIGPKG